MNLSTCHCFSSFRWRPTVLALCISSAVGYATPTIARESAAAPANAGAEIHNYNIAAQPLSEALIRFGQQSGLQVTANSPLLDGKQAAGVSGAMTARQALSQLLAGTGLSHRVNGAMVSLSTNEGAATLPPVRVNADSIEESAFEPLQGYVAKRGSVGTKTDAPLIETPQAVSVITRDEIAARNAQSITEVLQYTPGIQLGNNGGDLRTQWLSLRGFDAARTGLYRDGMRIPNVADGFANGDFEPYGLERVEVLRGPASVLYGQAKPGGIVSLVTKRPQLESIWEAELSAGSHDRHQAAIDINDMVGDSGRLLYRFTGLVRDSETHYDFGSNDRVYAAPAFTWMLSENTTLTFLSSYQKDSLDSTAVYALPIAGTLNSNPNGKIPVSRMYSEPDFDKFDKEQSTLGYLFEHQFNENVSFKQNLRFARLRLDYAALFAYALDDTQRIVTRGTLVDDESADSVTLDNQVLFNWSHDYFEHSVVAGIDYLQIDSDLKDGYGGAPALDIFNPVYGAPITTPEFSRDIEQKGKQFGVYVQDQIKFNERWVISLGARWDKSDVDISEAISSSETQQDDKELTKRAGLVYLFDSGFAPYVSYSTSFEPQIGSDESGNAFKPTEGEQAEFGFKYESSNGRNLFTASVFELTQQNVLIAGPNNTRVQRGEITSKGVELEGKLSFSERFNVLAAYTYLDTTYSRDNDGIEGNQVEHVPENTATVWADYSFHDGALEGLKLGLGARYTDEAYIDAQNSGELESRTLVDALVEYNWSQFSFRLNASNLFDKEVVSSCYSTDFGFCAYAPPRSVTATIRYMW